MRYVSQPTLFSVSAGQPLSSGTGRVVVDEYRRRRGGRAGGDAMAAGFF